MGRTFARNTSRLNFQVMSEIWQTNTFPVVTDMSDIQRMEWQTIDAPPRIMSLMQLREGGAVLSVSELAELYVWERDNYTPKHYTQVNAQVMQPQQVAQIPVRQGVNMVFAVSVIAASGLIIAGALAAVKAVFVFAAANASMIAGCVIGGAAIVFLILSLFSKKSEPDQPTVCSQPQSKVRVTVNVEVEA